MMATPMGTRAEFRPTEISSWWLSWYATDATGPWTLHTPWWVTGETGDGSAKTICAAIRAPDEDAAKALIIAAHDTPPASLEWRFCEYRPDDWSPFSGSRFGRADWMQWDTPPPSATEEG